jgi:hypothetical protein
MKNANEPIRNRTRNLLDFDAVPQTTALLLINCTIRKEFTYSCATEIRIAVFTGPTNSLCVTVDTAGHNFIFIYLKDPY